MRTDRLLRAQLVAAGCAAVLLAAGVVSLLVAVLVVGANEPVPEWASTFCLASFLVLFLVLIGIGVSAVVDLLLRGQRP